MHDAVHSDFCFYIGSCLLRLCDGGGDSFMWLERMREMRESLAVGSVLWFPSPELTTAFASQGAAFDNGIWLFPAVVLQILGVGEQMSYCIFTAMIGAVTMGAAYWMMSAFFENRITVLYGVLFYMVLPIPHIYLF